MVRISIIRITNYDKNIRPGNIDLKEIFNDIKNDYGNPKLIKTYNYILGGTAILQFQMKTPVILSKNKTSNKTK